MGSQCGVMKRRTEPSSGSWVGATTILTARHCLMGVSKSTGKVVRYTVRIVPSAYRNTAGKVVRPYGTCTVKEDALRSRSRLAIR